MTDLMATSDPDPYRTPAAAPLPTDAVARELERRLLSHFEWKGAPDLLVQYLFMLEVRKLNTQLAQAIEVLKTAPPRCPQPR
jgi:hypothetical protein